MSNRAEQQRLGPASPSRGKVGTFENGASQATSSTSLCFRAARRPQPWTGDVGSGKREEVGTSWAWQQSWEVDLWATVLDLVRKGWEMPIGGGLQTCPCRPQGWQICCYHCQTLTWPRLCCPGAASCCHGLGCAQASTSSLILRAPSPQPLIGQPGPSLPQ